MHCNFCGNETAVFYGLQKNKESQIYQICGNCYYDAFTKQGKTE